MASLTESVTRFFGRVELVARGLDGERRAAELALERGRPLEARDHAREIVLAAPELPIGLALWAEAAAAAWLDHEVVAALSALVELAPFRGDAWLALGLAGLRVGWEGAREALERAARSPEVVVARSARVELADLDLAAGDAERALRWLDRAGGPDAPAVVVRRAECLLALGRWEEASRLGPALAKLDAPADGRLAVVRARLAARAGDDAEAVRQGQRAFVLEAPGGEELLVGLVARARDPALVASVRALVVAAERHRAAVWSAALALAEGRVDEARGALADAVREGDPLARAALLSLAQESRDARALRVLAERAPEALDDDLRAIADAASLAERGEGAAALERLDRVSGDAAAWADELRGRVYAGWVDAGGDGVRRVLAELGRLARATDRLDLLGRVEALTIEMERPLRVAVVGEFNAGKSTFLNALLGADVAPTGILPTTATLHWLAWAPDRFARVVLRSGGDRLVVADRLKETLKELGPASVDRVLLYAPLERLRRIEVIDTPGFNAPDPDHAARARRAFDEAHVVLWLLDAVGPLKESERRILADVAELGLPLQILVNKRDRLAPGALGAVLDHVNAGLAGAGLVTIEPPVALSARRALEAILAGVAPPEETGWAEVEALLERSIVGRSEALRERAVLRKSLVVAREVASASARSFEEARARADRAREEGDALRRAADRLRGALSEVAARASDDLSSARRGLEHDLRPLAEVDATALALDPELAGYVRERLAARLGPALRTALGREAGAWDPACDRAIRHLLMGAVASAQDLRAPVSSPARLAVEAAMAAASALEEQARARTSAAPVGGGLARLAALVAALGG